MLDTDFEHKGYFWLPEDPEEQLAGILKFSQAEGVVLDLFGYFDKYVNPYSKESNIILGITSSGKKVTLQNCFEHSRSMGMPGFASSSISSINLFIGDHFKTVEDLCFSELCISYKGINEWLDISGFEKPIYDGVNKELSVKYKKPSDIIFEIKDDWNLLVQFNYFAPLQYFHPVEKFEIRQAPVIVFKPLQITNFKEFNNQLHVFNSLISICYFSYPQVESIEYYITDEDNPENTKKIQWYYRHGINYSKLKKYSSRHDFLMTYKDIKVNSEDIFKNWYRLYEQASATIDTLAEELMHRNNNIEFRFLGLTQAMESFHQRIKGGKVNFIVRIERIMENLPLKIRKELVSDTNEFSKMIRRNRNFLTHHDEKLKDGSASLGELFQMSERLKIILITSILKEVGVDDSDLERIIISKGVFLFNHILKYENVENYIKDWDAERIASLSKKAK
jgi:ApeA N-terminal domain 1